MNEIEKQIAELRDKIWYHSKKYHVDNNPEISDFDYDKIFEKLMELERQYPQLITPDSPTQRVAPQTSSAFERVPHKLPMLSIENSYSMEDIREFDARICRLLKISEKMDYMVEPKIDGMAISLWYENGILTRGITRGDGALGELVTANVRTVRSIPLKLTGTAPPILEVRGEIYLSRKEFHKINENRAALS